MSRFGILALTASVLLPACERRLPSPQPSELAARGPRVVWTPARVAKMRGRLEVEPWRSAWSQVCAEAERALSTSPPSVVDDGGGHGWRTDMPYSSDGVYCPDANRHDYEQAIVVSRAVQALGIAWQLERDPRYADKAIAFIDRFCIAPSTRYDARPGDNSIEILITMPGIVFGADMVWDYGGWTEAQRRGFVTFCRTLVDSFELGWDRLRNNWDGWRVMLLMTVGTFLDDAKVVARAVVRFRLCIDQQIAADGMPVEEVKRTRSLRYTSMALSSLLQTGIVGQSRGLELLDTRGRDGAGLYRALDRLATALRNPETWPHDELEREITANYVFAGLWEIAVARWDDPRHRAVVERFGRPLDAVQGLRFATLLFAER